MQDRQELLDDAPLDGESKRERFIRIAERRTQAVMERLRILSNCSNRAAYEYTPADVEKIFGTIVREVEEARRKFDRTKGRREFKL